MVLVLSGMVGYLYFQQTRLMQSLNGLATIVASRFVHPEIEDDDSEDDESEDDDRVTVEKDVVEADVEVVELPERKTEEPIDTDTLQDKSASELKDMLTKKGIPFGKRDAKTVLIQLLKATA